MTYYPPDLGNFFDYVWKQNFNYIAFLDGMTYNLATSYLWNKSLDEQRDIRETDLGAKTPWNEIPAGRVLSGTGILYLAKEIALYYQILGKLPKILIVDCFAGHCAEQSYLLETLEALISYYCGYLSRKKDFAVESGLHRDFIPAIDILAYCSAEMVWNDIPANFYANNKNRRLKRASLKEQSLLLLRRREDLISEKRTYNNDEISLYLPRFNLEEGNWYKSDELNILLNNTFKGSSLFAVTTSSYKDSSDKVKVTGRLYYDNISKKDLDWLFDNLQSIIDLSIFDNEIIDGKVENICSNVCRNPINLSLRGNIFSLITSTAGLIEFLHSINQKNSWQEVMEQKDIQNKHEIEKLADNFGLSFNKMLNLIKEIESHYKEIINLVTSILNKNQEHESTNVISNEKIQVIKEELEDILYFDIRFRVFSGYDESFSLWRQCIYNNKESFKYVYDRLTSVMKEKYHYELTKEKIIICLIILENECIIKNENKLIDDSYEMKIKTSEITDSAFFVNKMGLFIPVLFQFMEKTFKKKKDISVEYYNVWDKICDDLLVEFIENFEQPKELDGMNMLLQEEANRELEWLKNNIHKLKISIGGFYGTFRFEYIASAGGINLIREYDKLPLQEWTYCIEELDKLTKIYVDKVEKFVKKFDPKNYKCSETSRVQKKVLKP